jgi:hypothetical protein
MVGWCGTSRQTEAGGSWEVQEHGGRQTAHGEGEARYLREAESAAEAESTQNNPAAVDPGPAAGMTGGEGPAGADCEEHAIQV